MAQFLENLVENNPIFAKQRSSDSLWEAVLQRDASSDGAFYYGVSSTGIYCRPTCPSRRPERKNVRFFSTADEAEARGFRACLRCHPESAEPWQQHFGRVREVCRLIEERLGKGAQPPSLEEIGLVVEVSPHHLQKSFTSVLGISPRQYADAVRLRNFSAVSGAAPVNAAARNAGYRSASRLYENGDHFLGMRPAVFRRGAPETVITYTLADSPLARLLVAATGRGVCAVKLGEDDAELEQDLREQFFAATIQKGDDTLAAFVMALLAGIVDGKNCDHLPLDVRATAFQWRVWHALRAIPAGSIAAYGEIAAAVGSPRASRAVGSACATNPVALAVPCHRAVRADNSKMSYRWGPEIKRQLIAREQEVAEKAAAAGV